MFEQVISNKAGWTRVAFGDVVRLSKARTKDPEAEGYERVVGLEHIDPGDLRIRRWADIADGTTFTSVFKPGQVLFGKRRAYQRKVAVADFSGVCSGDIYVLEPSSDALMPELLPFICQTDAFFDHAVGTSAGSLSPRTNWKSLADFEFLLPPIQEQARMVELLSSAESLVHSLTNALLAGRTLVRSMTDAPIQALQQNKASSAWSLLPLGEVAEVTKLAGFEYTKHIKYRKDGEIIAIRPLNIKNGSLVLDDIQTIDKETSDSLPRSKVNAGDVLITYIGAYVGEVLHINESDRFHLAPNIARIRSKGKINDRLLEKLLRGDFLQRQISSFTTATATPSLNMGDIRKLKVAFPTDKDAQLEFLRSIEQQESGCRQIEERLTGAKALLKQALEAIEFKA